MTRLPLIEADKAFLARLEPASKRVTFAHYVLAEIRGPRKATNAAYIVQEVRGHLQAAATRGAAWDAHKVQWLEAVEAYPDEFLRYIGWCLAWEQRSKREKHGYRWNQ
jgi:hypothetical protein